MTLSSLYDGIILGAGPAGLSVADHLQSVGLRVLVLEKGPIASHIAQYPTFMSFHSTRENVEINSYPLNTVNERPTRQEYCFYLARFAKDRGLDVRTYTEATSLERHEDGTFTVHARKRSGEEAVFSSRTVTVAVGAYDNPRYLGVPGEHLSKVVYHFKEPHDYVGSKVLVVGGRNSAIENCLALWRAGVEVSISYRRPEFSAPGVKYWLKPDIDNRVKKGEIRAYMDTVVEKIAWDAVTLRENATGDSLVVPNDFVICETGYNPPAAFLQSLGIKLDPITHVPEHDPETLESNVPGLYIAGTILAGNISGHVFIENSRLHGEVIALAIRDRMNRGAGQPSVKT
ncbi:MAG: NAD(P)-binding domain-containing protein [Sumerlaeia bacterium]